MRVNMGRVRIVEEWQGKRQGLYLRQVQRDGGADGTAPDDGHVCRLLGYGAQRRPHAQHQNQYTSLVP